MSLINLTTLFGGLNPLHNINSAPVNFKGGRNISAFKFEISEPGKDGFSTNPLNKHFKSKAEIELLEKTLIGIKEGTLTPQKQCEDGLCFADKLKKEECQIDWTKSAQDIHNLVRGVYKCPGAYFVYQGKIIKVMETEPLNDELAGSEGEFVRFSKQGIDVKTGKGILRLIKVKPEGKSEMLARDWANGIRH